MSPGSTYMPNLHGLIMFDLWLNFIKKKKRRHILFLYFMILLLSINVQFNSVLQSFSILFNPFHLCPINPGVFDLFWIFSGVHSRSASPRTARPSVPSPSPAMPSPGRSAMPSPIRPDSPDPAMMLQAPCFDTKTSCFFQCVFFLELFFFCWRL